MLRRSSLLDRMTPALVNTMYLLTEWEGRTGKYLARGPYVLTESQIFSVRPDHTQSLSILSYDHLLLKILKILLNLNRTRLHEIRPLSARNNYMKVYSKKIVIYFFASNKKLTTHKKTQLVFSFLFFNCNSC